MNVYKEQLWPSGDRHELHFRQNNSDMPKTLVAPHWHEGYEILYIRRGWGRQQINAASMSFYPGEVVVICPGDIHATEALSPKGCDVDIVQFAEDALYTGERWHDVLVSGVLRPKDGYNQLFDAISRYSRDTQPGHDVLMSGLLRLLFGALIRSQHSEMTAHYSPEIEQVCAYLQQADTLQLEQTARRFGYSPEHFSRKFHEETFISFRKYCEKIRMRRAMNLLQDGTNSLEEIADQLGYGSTSSFIRAFKRVYGTTPNAYRSRRSAFSG